MISSGAGVIGSQVSEHRGEKPPIRLRYCFMKGLQKSSAEMMKHRAKRSTDDIRTPQGRETNMANKGPPDQSGGSHLGRPLSGHLRAKKLPYRRDGE